MFKKNIYKDANDAKIKDINKFAGEYIDYLSKGKTERLCVNEALKLAKKLGYKDINEVKELKLNDKVYAINRNKNIVLYKIGKKKIVEGINILGAHIDSPRLDLKQNPLYESNNFALLDTHYYGGIKKYQWVTIPLALHGVVCKEDGRTIDINIGDDDNDPVFGISDLLIHLSADQMQKTAANVIAGEKLDVTFGSAPVNDKTVKENILDILKEKYDIEEEDFISAEIEVVPAGKAREYGIDRSMIAGYGHDDRVCAYTSLRAILDIGDNLDRTACCILVDKEEIGSVGATGAHSLFFENTIAKLLSLQNSNSILDLRNALTNSYMLSSDVSVGFDPLFPEVCEAKNSCYLGEGIVFNKYTGSRGKSGSNDANPEYFAKVRNIMNKAGVYFQTSELGRVDQGGGGTIAYILGNLNMNVVDAGVAVLNMHSPMEIVSKADVYEAYLAYKAFLNN